MADMTQVADFDSTIAALKQGLTAIPVDEAIALIDTWQRTLQGTDLAEDLGELKSMLTNGGDGASIGELLEDLGEDTAEAAQDVTGDAATKAQQIAQLLSQAGASLQ